MSRKTKNVAEMKFFSTGQIARMCGVSLATVQKWIDAGELECFRMPMTGSERRVPRQSLIDFLKKYDIPMDELYGDKNRVVLVATQNEELTKSVGKAAKKLNCELLVVDDGAEALLQAGLMRPDVFIFDVHLPGFGDMDALRGMAKSTALSNARIVVASDVSDKELARLKKLEVTAIGSKPELEVIEELLSA